MYQLIRPQEFEKIKIGAGNKLTIEEKAWKTGGENKETIAQQHHRIAMQLDYR